MKTLALIPARGGSKSIPGKNIKPLAGKPLLHYALEAALGTRGIDEVWVSSDSDEILSVARELGSQRVRALRRPAGLATDTASTESVMLHFAAERPFDRLVLIQATSPLVGARDLEGALALMDQTGADSVVSVTRQHRFLWRPEPGGFVRALNYRPEARPRRQDWDGELFENGAFYISSRELLLTTGCRLHGRVAPFIMAPETAVELDAPEDWDTIEALLHAKRKKEVLRGLPKIDLIVSDVDGVLTDGGMYYGPDGEALKKFNTKDGMGMRLWRESGRIFAVVTGENSGAVAARMRKLGVDEYHPGIADKLPVVKEISAKHNVPLERIAYIGDDVNDLEAMSAVGLAACPRDAHGSIRARAAYVCQARGGEGCVRELVDRLI